VSETSRKINLWKLLVPVALGVSVSIYLIVTNFNPAALHSIHLSKRLVTGLLLGVLTVISRDAAFMYKLRLSTGNKMTWLKTFQTITMWEFGACITPKISEAPFTLFVLKNSGLTYGKSVAVLMLNAFFDNLAFVVVFTGLYLVLGNSILTVDASCPDLAGHSIMQGLRGFAGKAWIGYVIILGAVIFLGIALFILPHATRRFFHRLSQFRIFGGIKDKIALLGDEVEITANEFKNMPASFWIKMSISTLINWVSRYLLAVSLLYAFADLDFNFLTALSRQYVLWIYTSIPATPGASGVAEISFIALNCEFMPVGLSTAIALIWRTYSYYLYLVLGMIVLPKWAKQVAEAQ
jgi:uncharacterized protein (TIRG00374 family)